MKCKQLQSLIYYGESKRIEFKQMPCEGVYKTICAFLNTDGGNLLIGVDDNGNVTGFKPSTKDIEAYHDAISIWSTDHIREEIIHVHGRSVWVIHIEPMRETNHSSAIWKGDKYVRIGNSTRRVCISTKSR
jgi:predicted HTH transcriptional regulator